MELIQLHYFHRVVQTGSFSQAGAQLNLSQSAVSRQVARLEEELGQKLLIRTGRGVALTEAGGTLLVYAKEMLDLADRAEKDLAELKVNPKGQVTIGLPPRFANEYGPLIVEQFRDLYPRAMITITEGLSHYLRELLMSNRIDLAIMFDPMPSPQLDYEIMSTETLVLLAPLNFPCVPAYIDVPALADIPLALFSGPNTMKQRLAEAAKKHRITLNIIAEVDSVRSVMALIERGVACSILPETALSYGVLPKEIQLVRIDTPGIYSELILATSNSGVLTRLQRDAAKLLRGLKAAEALKKGLVLPMLLSNDAICDS